MENNSDKIVELKQALLSSSHITQLQAIDEAKRFCIQKPSLIDGFKPIILILTKSNHPWVKKQAKRCLIQLKDRKKENSNNFSNPNRILNIDQYIGFLKPMITQDHVQKINKIIKRNEIDDSLNLKNKLKAIIENRIPLYLEKIFSKNDISKIAIKFRIDYNNNLEFLHLQIHKKLGIKLSRGDYLEI